MRCAECESENLQLDEVTCRYVCQNCHLVTNYTEGLIYDEAPVGSRPDGLRRFGTQQSTVDLLSQKTTMETKHATGELLNVDASQDQKSRTSEVTPYRKWRMSEAMNLIFKTSAQRFRNEFLMPAPKCYQDASSEFINAIDKHWKTYLQVIGEIGRKHWAVGFRKAVQAIEKCLDSREAYIKSCSRGGCSFPSRFLPLVKREQDVDVTRTTRDKLVKRHRDVLRVYRRLVNPGIVWTGMSALLDPNKHGLNPMFEPFSTLMEKPMIEELNENEIKYGEGSDDGTEITEASTTHSEEKRPTRKRARNVPTSNHRPSKRAENIFDVDSNEDEDEEGVMKKIEDKIAQLEPFTQITDINKLSELYDELVKCMRLIPLAKMDFSFKQWFWRGTVDPWPENRLMEYNLGLIFLSVMDMLTKTRVVYFSENNTIRLPIYVYEYFSMQDLATMCKMKEIPYLNADDLVIQHFSWNNTAIQSVFDRRRVPDPNLLSRVTTQLIHMIGYSMRPRLPLCQMVHRYLRWMGLPHEVHLLADNWIRRLGVRVREEVKEKEVGMHFYLPLQRYLRAEVFAMAIVVLSVRSLFKLDGIYEGCLSKVFEFLSKNPRLYESLRNLLKNGRDAVEMSSNSKPFIYLEWASNFTGCPKLGMKHRNRVQNEADAPIHSAVLFRDLCRLASTTEEFLGPDADFNPVTDLGWGEKTIVKTRKAASKETKLGLSDPLRQLSSKVTESSLEDDEDEVNGVTSIAEVLPSPCKPCQVALEHRIFQDLDNIHDVALNANHQTWSEFNCDAVYAAGEFIHAHQLTVEMFLDIVMKDEERTAELQEVIRDWSHLLTHRNRYDPIHTSRFPTENDLRRLGKFDLPDPVLDFLIYHNKRMQKLMAGESVDPSCLVNVYTDRKYVEAEEVKKKTNGRKKDASPSLNWLIELASMMCGSTVDQLMEEVKCIEKLLGYGPPINPRGPKKLEDLSMTYHFNYDIAPTFVLKKPT